MTTKPSPAHHGFAGFKSENPERFKKWCQLILSACRFFRRLMTCTEWLGPFSSSFASSCYLFLRPISSTHRHIIRATYLFFFGGIGIRITFSRSFWCLIGFVFPSFSVCLFLGDFRENFLVRSNGGVVNNSFRVDVKRFPSTS